MHILSIDTSSRTAKIGLLECDELPGGTEVCGTEDWDTGFDLPRPIKASSGRVALLRTLPPKQRTTRSLVPAIRDLVSEADWDLSTLDLIVTTTGPGSFTGLRIGITVAKTLAYALKCKLSGVPTLDLLVASSVLDQAKGVDDVTDADGTRFLVVMDAQRGEFFSQQYQLSKHRLQKLTPVQLIAAEDLGDRLANDRLVCCDTRSLEYSRAAVKANALSNSTTMVLAESDPLVLAQMGRLALCLEGENVFQLTPDYFRRSAAEEKLIRENS